MSGDGRPGRDAVGRCGVDGYLCHLCEEVFVADHPEATPVPDRHAEGLRAAHDAWQEAVGWRANRHELVPVLGIAIDAYLSATGLVELDAVVEALREARDTLGASHVVVEGPNAGWVDHCDGYYDEDLVPALDCQVCALQKKIDGLLARFGSGEGTDHDE